MDDVVNETVAVIAENSTGNGTAKVPATTEGLLLAYSSLFIMAIIPIWVGSFKSVRFLKESKINGETPETMTKKDAAMFPIIASCALFGIYLLFQFFSKEYVNLLLTFYFFGLGILAVARVLTPLGRRFIPDEIPYLPKSKYRLTLIEMENDTSENLFDYKFDVKDVIIFGVSGAFGLWYLIEKHWVANNIIGYAFAVNGVELLQLNSVMTACILLGGLFFYDVFWVFGTNVMVTVAKSFDAPIKLVFPQDLIEKGLAANNFGMLGLGDIVIPGIFIALLLRYDVSLNRGSRTYFYAGFIAYILGLLTTILVMHVFKHAQPALLYLVPFCICTPIGLAAIKGDVQSLFAYEDNPETEKKDK